MKILEIIIEKSVKRIARRVKIAMRDVFKHFTIGNEVAMNYVFILQWMAFTVLSSIFFHLILIDDKNWVEILLFTAVLKIFSAVYVFDIGLHHHGSLEDMQSSEVTKEYDDTLDDNSFSRFPASMVSHWISYSKSLHLDNHLASLRAHYVQIFSCRGEDESA